MNDTRLILGDAVSVLKSLPASSVKVAAFDPPYPTISGGSNEGKTNNWDRPSGILTKNDGRIFQHNDITPEEYLPEVFRVLEDEAHLYLMTNFLGLRNGLLAKVEAAGFGIHNLLVWRKNNATPNRWYMKDLEYTIFARKGRAYSINDKGCRTSQDVFPHPLDWPSVPSPRTHPTEKPVALMKTYIENSSSEGDLVLDPFCGTGATGVAAQEAGRRFIGIELAPEYGEKAAERLGVSVETFSPVETDADMEEMLA